MSLASEDDLPEVLGAYRVVRRLATGGTSDVLLARSDGPYGRERPVVLKVLLQELRDDDRFGQMFVREAAAYARLSHPAIVRLYDFFADTGGLVLVLEYIDGLPLHRLMALLHRANTSMADPAALFVGWRLFSGLAAAHAAQDPGSGVASPVIHGDVNPSNVLIPWDGHLKIADFGMAKVTGIDNAANAGLMKGTYGYSAPEQVRGEAVTLRSDVYSGCVMLWELLAHRKAVVRQPSQPAVSSSTAAAMAFPPLRALRPDLPPAILDAFDRGLQPEPARRWLTAAEMCTLLRGVVDLQGGRRSLVEALDVARRPILESQDEEDDEEDLITVRMSSAAVMPAVVSSSSSEGPPSTPVAKSRPEPAPPPAPTAQPEPAPTPTAKSGAAALAAPVPRPAAGVSKPSPALPFVPRPGLASPASAASVPAPAPAAVPRPAAEASKSTQPPSAPAVQPLAQPVAAAPASPPPAAALASQPAVPIQAKAPVAWVATQQAAAPSIAPQAQATPSIAPQPLAAPMATQPPVAATPVRPPAVPSKPPGAATKPSGPPTAPRSPTPPRDPVDVPQPSQPAPTARIGRMALDASGPSAPPPPAPVGAPSTPPPPAFPVTRTPPPITPSPIVALSRTSTPPSAAIQPAPIVALSPKSTPPSAPIPPMVVPSAPVPRTPAPRTPVPPTPVSSTPVFDLARPRSVPPPDAGRVVNERVSAPVPPPASMPWSPQALAPPSAEAPGPQAWGNGSARPGHPRWMQAAAGTAALALAIFFVLSWSRSRTSALASPQPEGPLPRGTAIQPRPSATPAPAQPPRAEPPPPEPAPSPAEVSPAPASTRGTITSLLKGGHRVWIDSKIVGQSPASFSVPCGPHSVRVGSHGATRRVDVSCGTEVFVK